MDNQLPTEAVLTALSDQQFEELKSRVAKEQKRRDFLLLKKRIDASIEKRGYFLDFRNESKWHKFDGYLQETINFKFSATCYHKYEEPQDEDVEIWDIDECDESEDSILSWWFIKRDECPTLNERLTNLDIDFGEPEWIFECDADDPYRGVYPAKIPVFFRKQPFPSPGKYNVIDLTGLGRMDVITVHPNETYTYDEIKYTYSVGDVKKDTKLVHSKEEWVKSNFHGFYLPYVPSKYE